MNKKIAVLLIFITIFLNAEILYADSPLKKLGRGIANVLTCPLEVVKGVSDVNKESGPLAAFTWGIIRGVFKTGIRAVVGVYEIGTFIIPIPDDWGPILTDPEFFWEDVEL